MSAFPLGRAFFLFVATLAAQDARLPVVSSPWRAAHRESWRRVAATDAPVTQGGHLAVFTGTEMIVWGGFVDGIVPVRSGARYDPAADAWRPLSLDGAPRARVGATAVWTGSEMIVWGGFDASDLSGHGYFADGARYDPVLDTWRPVPAPGFLPGRFRHTAVWTGTEMIVWGGQGGNGDALLADGAAFDPATERWRALAPAPLDGRRGHAAAWTGTEMIVWGGADAWGGDVLRLTATGARYDPGRDAWTAMSGDGRPAGTSAPRLAWTGSRVFVVSPEAGRRRALGDVDGPPVAAYVPFTDRWENIPPPAGFSDRCSSAPGYEDLPVVWTGEELVLFSESGARYSPKDGRWRALASRGQPERSCAGQTAVWTGREMLVFGFGPPYWGAWIP